MKTRNGYVSNSSSASFIVEWKPKRNTLDNLEMWQDIGELLDLIEDWDDEAKQFVDRFKLMGKATKTANWALQKTRLKDNGVYKTSVYISMRNSVADYDDEFAFFMLALLASNCVIAYHEDFD
ncbi:MAG: hypothetical protein WC375_12625 [Methanomassiliicoccales archaeon]|jgi:hypothetical protein